MPVLNSPAETRRNTGIDVLRGVAVLLVVLHHIGLRFPLRETALADLLPKRILNGLIYNGYEAVFVFFVISGFLITHHSLQRWGSLARIELRAFYLRRFARIVPSLLLLTAMLSLLHWLGAGHYVIDGDGQSLAGAVAATFGMHLNWYEGMHGYLPGNWDVLWSLSIEELFYLGLPLLCWLLPSRWALLTVLLALALSLPMTRAVLDDNQIWQEKAYLPGMAAIATGVLTALLAEHSRSWSSNRRQRSSTLLLCLGALGLFGILFYEGLLWQLLGNGTMLILTCATACLVLASHWRGGDAGSADNAPPRGIGWLCRIGQQSYEIYLSHMFVVYAKVDLAAAANLDKKWGYLWYVPATLLSCLLGAAVARFYSTPCDRWLRRRFLARPATVAGIGADKVASAPHG